MRSKLTTIFIGVFHFAILGSTMASEFQEYPVKAASEKELRKLLESQYVSCRYATAEEDGRKIVAVFRDTGFGVVREDLFIYSISDDGEATLVVMMPYSRVQAKDVEIVDGIASITGNDGNVLLSGRLQ